MMMAGSLWCPWTFFQSSNEIPRSKQLRHVSSQHPGASAMLNISVTTSSTSLVSFLAISGNFWPVGYGSEFFTFQNWALLYGRWRISVRENRQDRPRHPWLRMWTESLGGSKFSKPGLASFGEYEWYILIYIYDIRILIFGKGLLGFSETEVSIFMLWRLF